MVGLGIWGQCYCCKVGMEIWGQCCSCGAKICWKIAVKSWRSENNASVEEWGSRENVAFEVWGSDMMLLLRRGYDGIMLAAIP